MLTVLTVRVIVSVQCPLVNLEGLALNSSHLLDGAIHGQCIGLLNGQVLALVDDGHCFFLL